MKRLLVIPLLLFALGMGHAQISGVFFGPVVGKAASNPTSGTPTFSPGAGSYSSTQSVTISATGGSVICYNTTGSPATNGTTGCTTGTLYTGAVSVSTSETLYAVSGGTGYTDSAIGSATYTISAGSPTFVAINEYNAPVAFSVTTSSSTCPIGHVRIFIANDAVPTDTLTLTTTTGNAITTRVAYTGVNGSYDAYVQAWTSTCTGSTGTYTLTATSYYYNQLIDYEASSGTYDTSNACSVASGYGPLSCSITSSGADLVVTSVTNTYSTISPTSGITGWTNRLNISDASAWDQTGSPGTITFSTSSSGVGSPEMTVMIGLHP